MATTNFYTSNGWQGSNYNSCIRGKEVAKLLREYIKDNDDLNGCKWSIRVSGCGYSSDRLEIALMAAPFDPFTEYFKENKEYDYKQGYTQHATYDKFITPQCLALINKVQNFVLGYVRDDSNAMIDYFDRNIYDHYTVGKFDKPFQICEPKKAKSKPAKTEATGKKGTTTTGLQLIEYSEKAFAVIGNTKEFKDTLKKLGGKFNSRLSCGAGWIFSKKCEPELRALIAG